MRSVDCLCREVPLDQGGVGVEGEDGAELACRQPVRLAEGIPSGCPGVRECVVFGVPDGKWGERVEAAVEIVAGTNADTAEIIGFARQALGPVKTPKRIHFYGELPRGAVGKAFAARRRPLSKRTGNRRSKRESRRNGGDER